MSPICNLQLPRIKLAFTTARESRDCAVVSNESILVESLWAGQNNQSRAILLRSLLYPVGASLYGMVQYL